ncbi:MAG: hypothetical protein IPK80_17270 [Nannocystis sp.]|nr:hypothetical protein [Nannocystis sp.]
MSRVEAALAARIRAPGAVSEIARVGALAAAVALGGAPVGGCGERASGLAAATRGEGEASQGDEVAAARSASSPGEVEAEAEAEARRRQESPHHVVFADRISQSYALLLADTSASPPATPSREALRAQVEEAFARDLEDPEVALLLAMIMRTPAAAGAGAPVLMAPSGEEEEAPGYQRARELLALHVEVGAIAELVEQGAFADPALIRGLSPEELGSLAARRWVLVLRADYRNQNGVRGLRLLQTLVRVVAEREGALIYDPDTQETVGPGLFTARRLRAELGNVADQVAVVPFSDPRHGEGFVRLTTRGMRRFGSVDLELDGLPATQRALQRATFLLHGLARVMVKLGEAEASGLAVEAPAVIRLTYRDCDLAYAGRGAQVPRCAACPEEIALHLVERAREPHDPLEHVVARVVAPRGQSDASARYDHPAWAASALVRLFGE